MSTIKKTPTNLGQFISDSCRRILGKKCVFTTFPGNLKKGRRIVKLIYAISATLMLIAFFFYLFVFAVGPVQQIFVKKINLPENQVDSEDDPEVEKAIARLEREHARLLRRYNALTPKQNYLIVNTSDNHFYLYRGTTLIREGFVSTGSYIRLQSHDDREWLFRTPKGKHTVKGKVVRPVWRKPDWAFIEEGLPVPPRDHHSRFEAGVLGDYALSLGGGYLIHGTLYKRLLGMPVTHGCIRLDDDDLEFIYNSLNVGSHVYIY